MNVPLYVPLVSSRSDVCTLFSRSPQQTLHYCHAGAVSVCIFCDKSRNKLFFSLHMALLLSVPPFDISIAIKIYAVAFFNDLYCFIVSHAHKFGVSEKRPANESGRRKKARQNFLFCFHYVVDRRANERDEE
jgi:hypothetical protein